MILKNFKDFINEEKEDNPIDAYYDDSSGKLEEQVKEFNRNKSKLDSLIKDYDYSDNSDRKLNKIINSNPLLMMYWSILKKTKRVTDLKEKVDSLTKEIKDLKNEEDSEEAIDKKKEKIDSLNEEIKRIEKENKELKKSLEEKQKEIKQKVIELKKKLID